MLVTTSNKRPEEMEANFARYKALLSAFTDYSSLPFPTQHFLPQARKVQRLSFSYRRAVFPDLLLYSLDFLLDFASFICYCTPKLDFYITSLFSST